MCAPTSRNPRSAAARSPAQSAISMGCRPFDRPTPCRAGEVGSSHGVTRHEDCHWHLEPFQDRQCVRQDVGEAIVEGEVQLVSDGLGAAVGNGDDTLGRDK